MLVLVLVVTGTTAAVGEHGARPGDIPIEANPRIEMVINLKVARKLGLKVPAELLARADRVVE